MKKFLKSIVKAFSEVDWANVPKAVYVRYILAFIAIVNSILVGCGLHPLDVAENDVYMVVSVIFSVLVIIVNTYKDNPTSKEGIMSASIRNMLKEMDDLKESGVLDELEEWLASKKRDEPKKSESEADTNINNETKPEDAESSDAEDK
jgi:SPP1 family holin|nr:MAG TPA: holin [Caudoviricetes sp.]